MGQLVNEDISISCIRRCREMILRIIDKQTKLFIRDDFDYSTENEIGLEVEPAQGLYAPKWNGETWEEGATEIPEPTPAKPTETDLFMLAIADLDTQREKDKTDDQIAMAELAELLLGGF